LLAAYKSPHRLELIQRFFSIAELKSLRLDTRNGHTRLEFESGRLSSEEALTLLRKVFQGDLPRVPLTLPHEAVILGDHAPSLIEIHRVSSCKLSLWRTDSLSERAVRLTHPLLVNEEIREEVLEELRAFSDAVIRVRSLGSSLFISLRPHRLDHSRFAELLDPVLTRILAQGIAGEIEDELSLLTNANLALAPIADFIFPPLGLFHVATTWLLNRRHITRATVLLKQGKATLDLLHLTIAALSVLTFEFLPAAMMYWLGNYWPSRSASRIRISRKRFLSRYRPRLGDVWVEKNGTTIETPLVDITPASVITLSPGDVVPGDGTVLSGSALLSERLLTGIPEGIAKSEGSPLYAATRVLKGNLRIQVNERNEATAVSRLREFYRQSLEREEAPTAAFRQAEKAVLPILLAGTLGFFRGGLAMTKAAIRPDYHTGPALAEKLFGLASVIRASKEGILFSPGAALEKLHAADLIVFDDTVPWQTDGLDQPFEQAARSLGIKDLIYCSKAGREGTELAASRLGFTRHRSGASSATKLHLIAEQQLLGRSVLYVGDCSKEPGLAEAADLAISVLNPPFAQAPRTPISLLAPRLEKLLTLHALATDFLDERKTAFQMTLVPNVLAVGAALFLGGSVYASILLTSLGPIANYFRSATLLRFSEDEERV
jgi:hypothetical protein